MQDALAAFFSTQLDFIFFFYGLAFILLGNVCFAIARLPDRKVWQVLGGFGVLHGLGEWLDLMALVVGDSAAFALVRLALMTVSFLLLLEFARRQAVLSPVRPPGPWIHFLLAALVVVAALAGGPSAANATARYAIAFVGAISVSGVFAWQAFTQLSGAARRLALLTALGLALYGVAAGLIVPAAPFWPASVVNQTGFLHLTGVPIQLVRGVLACWVAGAVWAVWGRLVAREVASESYTAYLQRQLLWAAIGMLAILSGGWVLTQDLGGVYERGLETESRGDLDLLASRMAGETAAVDSMIRALAGSPEVVDRLTRGGDPEAARRTLALDAEASGAAAGYLLDRAGSVVAAVGSSAAPGGGARPYLAGAPGRLFTVDGPNVGYDASQAVRRPDGAVVGTAILHRSLAGADADLAGFDRAFYLVDGAGVVRMTNRPAQRLQRLWPTPATAAAGAGVKPILPRTVADAGWVESDGHRQFVRRRNLGQGGWSLVIITPTEGIFASRVLGIIITLLAAMTTLVFLFGRERLVRDHVQMDRRLELQALAQSLRRRAATDPLTGLANRLGLDEALAQEIARARRYDTPLALVIYDIDHFKRINDAHGHPVGDAVLVRLSSLVAARIRASDLLARWGGEEFVLLTPQSDLATAAQAAEKLRAAVCAEPFEDIGEVTCSFGVAELAEGDDAQTLIARADAALYRAKMAGRNRVEQAAPPVSPRRKAS